MFRSVLFEGEAERAGTSLDLEVAADLNIDQIVGAAIGQGDEGFLRPIYLTPPATVQDVSYRQEICLDLEDRGLREAVALHGRRMAGVRAMLAAAPAVHRYQRLRWMLDAAQIYGQTVHELAENLGAATVHSSGLAAFRDYLTVYAGSGELTTLLGDASSCREALDGVRYNLHIDENRVRVLPYGGEADQGAEIDALFARFGRGATREHVFNVPAGEMTRVDREIVERVARLYPAVFHELERFGERHAGFIDSVVGRFGREAAFYLGYLDLIEPLRAAGLAFCYPAVAPEGDVEAGGGFDLALAIKLLGEGGGPVANDFSLGGRERILVVTGPNQGGKTTFARMFGQLHHLACLGLPVPATSARLRFFDRIFSHFDRPEHGEDLRGKLEDDLVRLHSIVDLASSRSIVILNESLSSTTADDALAINTEVIATLLRRGAIGVFVTFLDEISRMDDAVSLVAGVDQGDLTRRTHNIVRRPADGLAYAAALAEKYGVTYAAIRKQVSQ
jgi:hypothetical protein